MINSLLRDTKVYLKQAGIELSAPFTLTTLRKSFAQNHTENGTPPTTLAKLMGHSSVATTMEYYSRVTDADEQAATAMLDTLLSATVRITNTGTDR
jgi:integrase